MPRSESIRHKIFHSVSDFAYFWADGFGCFAGTLSKGLSFHKRSHLIAINLPKVKLTESDELIVILMLLFYINL